MPTSPSFFMNRNPSIRELYYNALCGETSFNLESARQNVHDIVFGRQSCKSKKPEQKINYKPYSARTGLKLIINYGSWLGDKDVISDMSIGYKKCLHCAYYSFVFYNKSIMRKSIKVIENDYDFEQVKKQYVRHMNRSHPDICKRKLMKRLDNKQKLV